MTSQIVEKNTCFYVWFQGELRGSFTTRVGAITWLESQVFETTIEGGEPCAECTCSE